MANFLERNGFISPETVIIREAFPKTIENAVCDAFFNADIYHLLCNSHGSFDKYLWRDIYHNALNDYGRLRNTPFFIEKIKDSNVEWYNKLYILEEYVKWVRDHMPHLCHPLEVFKNILNADFEKRNYAYRFICYNVEDVTSKEEINAIKEALDTDHTGVKIHLQTALQFLSVAQQEPN